MKKILFALIILFILSGLFFVTQTTFAYEDCYDTQCDPWGNNCHNYRPKVYLPYGTCCVLAGDNECCTSQNCYQCDPNSCAECPIDTADRVSISYGWNSSPSSAGAGSTISLSGTIATTACENSIGTSLFNDPQYSNVPVATVGGSSETGSRTPHFHLWAKIDPNGGGSLVDLGERCHITPSWVQDPDTYTWSSVWTASCTIPSNVCEDTVGEIRFVQNFRVEWCMGKPNCIRCTGYQNYSSLIGTRNIRFTSGVNCNPTPTVTCSASPSTIYAPDTMIFTAHASGGAGSYRYNWGGECNGNSNLVSTCLKGYGSGDGGHTYTTTVSATAGGKTSSTASCSVVVKYPQVNASCTANPTSVGLGDRVDRSATNETGGNGSYTYSWTGNGITSGTTVSGGTTQRTIGKTYPSVGTYSSSVTVSSGGGTYGSSKTANCPNVTVGYEPVTDLNTSCTCNGTTSTLTATWGSSASNFLVRMDYANNNTGSCTDGWYCASPPDYQNNSYTSKSFTMSNLPNGSYDFWVHEGTPSSYGPENKVRNIQCQCAKCGSAATGGDSSATPSGGWRTQKYNYTDTCNKSFPLSGTSLCEAGSQSPSTVSAPILGGTANWTCGGKNCRAESNCPDSSLRVYNGGTIKIAGVRSDLCSSTSPLKMKGSDGYIYDIILVDPGTTYDSGQRINTGSGTKATAKCP